MVFHNFDELIAHVKGQPSRARMAVAAAGDAHTIEAVLRARAEGIVTPILVGDKAVIDQVLAELGEHIPAEDIHDEPDLAEAARKAVALVRAGEADFLMKGKLDTSVLLKAVVNKETGLGKGGVMSHFTAFEIPTYHKLLMPVDGGMVTYPTLEQKKAIIENTVGAAGHGLRLPQGGRAGLRGEAQPQDARDRGGRRPEADEPAGRAHRLRGGGPHLLRLRRQPRDRRLQGL